LNGRELQFALPGAEESTTRASEGFRFRLQSRAADGEDKVTITRENDFASNGILHHIDRLL